MKIVISFSLYFLLFNYAFLFAKEIVPVEVKPLIINNVEYSAPHKKMGMVVARSVENNVILWSKRIYTIHKKKKPNNVYIIEIKKEDDYSLIITDQRGRNYELTLIDRKVKALLPKKIPRSYKGYEIIARRIYRSRFYCLVTGTNNGKTEKELFFEANVVKNGFIKLTVKGEEELIKLLDKIPKGQYIVISVYDGFPKELLEKITTYCKDNGLEVD